MKKSLSNSREQYRRFCGYTYLTVDDMFKLIQEKSNIIRDYAFILHDRDVNDDGTPKVPHIHFIFCMAYGYPLSTVSRWFRGWYDEKGQSINSSVEPCFDLFGAYEYLDHHTHPEKAQYDQSCIHKTNSKLFKSEIESIPEDTVFMALDAMLNGASYYELARRYGRDFIIHYRSLRDLAEDIKHQEQILNYKKNKKECEEKTNVQNFGKTNQ